MFFVIQGEIYIFWVWLRLIALNFSLCKWDVNSLSKLLLLIEKKSRWLLKQFIPHSSRIGLWRCLSLLRAEGSLDSSFVESLEMPNVSLWAEVLFLAVCFEKNEGQDSKMRRQWCLPQASDRVVQLTVCGQDSAQWNHQSCCSFFPANLLPEERSCVLWPKCQHPYLHSPCEWFAKVSYT